MTPSQSKISACIGDDRSEQKDEEDSGATDATAEMGIVVDDDDREDGN